MGTIDESREQFALFEALQERVDDLRSMNEMHADQLLADTVDNRLDEIADAIDEAMERNQKDRRTLLARAIGGQQ